MVEVILVQISKVMSINNFIRVKKYSGNFILQTARSNKKKHIEEILINKNFFEKHYFE